MVFELTLTTKISLLRATHVNNLVQILSSSHDWKKLADVITNRNGQRCYGVNQLRQLETLQRGHPVEQLLLKVASLNYDVEKLISFLHQCDLQEAVEYLYAEIGTPEDKQEDFNAPQEEKSKEPVMSPTYLPFDVDDDLLPLPGVNPIPVNQIPVSHLKRINAALDNQEPSPPPYTKHDISEITQRILQREQHLSSISTNGTDDSLLLSNDNLVVFTSTDLHVLTHSYSTIIGKGGFSEVYKGEGAGIHDLAVKRLIDTSSDAMKYFEREVIVISRISHDNIIPLIGYCKEENHQSLVYPHMCKGSLEEKLKTQTKTSALSVTQRIKIIHGLVAAVHYLHTLDPCIIHRDIKTANILLDKDFIPKLADFGILVYGPPTLSGLTHAVTTVAIGSKVYMPLDAQEFEDDQVVVRTALDIYAFGVVLLEILTGLPAFDKDRDDQDLPNHVKEHYNETKTILIDPHIDWSGKLPQHIFNLADRCLKNKFKRPKIKQIASEVEMWTGPVSVC